MKKYILFFLPVTLLFITILFTILVFIPNIKSYEIVTVQTPKEEKNIEEVVKNEDLETLLDMGKDISKTENFSIKNRELPKRWRGKNILFKYTYIGEYNTETKKKLDSLLVGEYQWQKQYDTKGNILVGGIILKKDGTYQLHTHNSFTKGNFFLLLGDILHYYYDSGTLLGTEVTIGDITLNVVWIKDMEVDISPEVEYADLIVSTCLERYGDRRLVVGFDIK